MMGRQYSLALGASLATLLFGGCGSETNHGAGESSRKFAGANQALLAAGDVLYRVNAGGPEVDAVDDGPDWLADTAEGASTLRVAGGLNLFATDDLIQVPEGFGLPVPVEVLQSERWDAVGGDEMHWSFPVDAGLLVEVRIYFAETFYTTSGERTFSIAVDGQDFAGLSDIDVFDEVGHDAVAVRRIQVESDGDIDLVWNRGEQNPMVKAIELVELGQTLFRVNAGGPELSSADGSEPAWSADTLAAPSQHLVAGGNKLSGTADLIVLQDTITSAAPMGLFQTERYDQPSGQDMTWAFPVEKGRPVQVRLLFAETFLSEVNAETAGPRVFDVLVDTEIPTVFDDVDVYAEVGHDNALMKSHDLISDGQVDLAFLHDTQNPMVKGIEVVLIPGVIEQDDTPNEQAASFLSPAYIGGGVIGNPTTLEFGPDERLYVGQKNGQVQVFTVVRNGPGEYEVTETENIPLVANLPNRNDDSGELNTDVTTRQVTGLLATGSAENPVLYVTSSDPRIGAGGGGSDLNLDTNSGIVSRLTWTGEEWQHEQLVRGLPRSEENHASNGMALDAATNTLYLAQGGHTNAGAPSNNFAFTTEYALSAAILTIDLDAIDDMPQLVDASGNLYRYDLPTLDDPTRDNVNGINDPTDPDYDGVDVADPFGGNDGLNQAKIVPGGPVQIHSGGWRNPYDVVLTESGRLYSVDNGANANWGGHPLGEGAYPGETAGQCTHDYDPTEPGSTGPGPNDGQVNNKNGLHHIRVLEPGEANYPGHFERYYAGHPAPVRGNPEGAGFFLNGEYLPPGDPGLPVDWPPVPASEAHPAECDFRNSGVTDGALVNYGPSTNGITEYTASNFSGAMKGNLLSAAFNGNIWQVELDETGNVATNCPEPPTNCSVSFASGFGSLPLDVIAQGDNDPFPGTVWVALFGSNSIAIFEPSDFDNPGGPGTLCSLTDPEADSDDDGFSNGDEAANSTDPCSGASMPDDHDGDLLSNLLDADDDNDGIDDVDDAFAWDADNGTITTLPIEYEFFNADPGFGFFGLGFTGLMVNGSTDYLDQFDPNEVVAGGTAGLLTVPVTQGEALGATNTQDNGFQLGVGSDSTWPTFTVVTQVNAPFFNGLDPVDFQAQGVQLGTGDQDNYLQLMLSGSRGLEVTLESAGAVVSSTVYAAGVDFLGETAVKLFLTVDPSAGSIQPAYQLGGEGPVVLGAPVVVTGSLLAAIQGTHNVNGMPSALAVGISSTASGSGPEFSATWDFLRVLSGVVLDDGTIGPAPPVIPPEPQTDAGPSDPEPTDAGAPPAVTDAGATVNDSDAGLVPDAAAPTSTDGGPGGELPSDDGGVAGDAGAPSDAADAGIDVSDAGVASDAGLGDAGDAPTEENADAGAVMVSLGATDGGDAGGPESDAGVTRNGFSSGGSSSGGCAIGTAPEQTPAPAWWLALALLVGFRRTTRRGSNRR